MSRPSTFLGILLVAGGVLLLAGNLLRFDIWPLLLPALLILLGVWFIAGTLLRGKGTVETEDFSLPLAGASRARLEVRHGAGRLRIASGAASGNLAEGTFIGGVRHTEARSGETLSATLSIPERVWLDMPWMFGPWTTLNWNLRLNGAIPMALDLQTGAGESQIDLADIRAEEIHLATGASSTDIVLPARAGRYRVAVESGAAAVSIRVPDGVAARITVESGLAGIQIDPARFPKTTDGYESPDFASASQAAEIHIETGVGSVDVR